MAGSEHKCLNKWTYWRFIITVEPVILLYVSSTNMYGPLLQQYMYDEMSKHFNFTAADIHDICSKNRPTNFTNSTQLNITSFRKMDELSNTEQDLHGIENKVQTETSHWILYINLASKYVFYSFSSYLLCLAERLFVVTKSAWYSSWARGGPWIKFWAIKGLEIHVIIAWTKEAVIFSIIF